MIILMVAASFSPYAEVGPAASHVAALSRTLVQLGHEVSVMLPKHPGFEEKGLLLARRLSPLALPGGGAATVFDGQLGSGVKLVLVEVPPGLERLSTQPQTQQEPRELAEPLGFFAQAVARLVRERAEQGNPFDLVHAHDWPGALALVQVKAASAPPACVLSVHDLSRPGLFAADAAGALRVPPEVASQEALRMSQGLCALKGGALVADAITAPSPTVATELADESRWGPLALTWAARAGVTTGIVPGLDYAVWNPATDSELPARFDAEHLGAKGSCRTALLRELGIDADNERPLLVSVLEGDSAAEAAKVRDLCGELLRNNLSLVMVGAGLGQVTLPESARKSAALVEPSNASWERKLYAAADLALCLEAYPSDGSAIRKAQRYAAVPIARDAGAARDLVVDCDVALETGTGFLVQAPVSAMVTELPAGELPQSALQGTMGRAIAGYLHPSWSRLQRRVARLDLSWDRSARRVLQVYRQALGQ